jgi:hypothetical protein
MRIILRRGSFVALAVGLLATSTASAGLLFNPVVTVVGDGTNITSGVGVTTTDRVYLNSVASQVAPLSSAAYNSSTAGTRLVNSFSASSEGSLTNNPGISDAAAQGVSYAGTAFVYNAGYDAADNTASVNGTAANANRSLGQINVTASLATGATVLKTQTQATAYNNNNIRGATGDNTGTNIYSAGTASTAALGGWRNFNTNTILSSTPTNVRTVELLGGNLYGSTGSGNTGIYQVDPTGATAATPFIITGSSASPSHSPYEFALFDDLTNTSTINGYNVAYIADDAGGSGATGGGIEKWTYNGTAWSQAYILQDTTTTFYRGLAGEKDPATGLVTLFASTADGLKLQQVTDNGVGAASPFTTLASFVAADNRVFRGVALAPVSVPEPSTCLLAIMAAIGGTVAMRRRARLNRK